MCKSKANIGGFTFEESPILVGGKTHDELRELSERDPEGFKLWSKKILQSEIDKLPQSQRFSLTEAPNGSLSIKPQLFLGSNAIDALRQYKDDMHSFASMISSLEVTAKEGFKMQESVEGYLKDVYAVTISIKFWNVVSIHR